jgi:hypothetical protein
MSTPKLREGITELLVNRAVKCAENDDKMSGMFVAGARWALDNLHKLLEPNSTTFQIYCDAGQPSKPVAIVELEE